MLMPRIREIFARSSALRKSWPPSMFVVFEKSLEPIALHWPVIELAPVPSRPILPVISARLNDRLRHASGLVALIHTHCPPERDTAPPMDRLRKFFQLLCVQSG